MLAAHRPAPVRSRVANSLIRGAEWLITRLHKFDSYERATARKTRAQLTGTAPKQPQLPCDARELAQRYVRMPMRTPRAYCSLRAVAPRCPLFASAATANLSSHDSAPRRHNTRPPRPHD